MNKAQFIIHYFYQFITERRKEKFLMKVSYQKEYVMNKDWRKDKVIKRKHQLGKPATVHLYRESGRGRPDAKHTETDGVLINCLCVD